MPARKNIFRMMGKSLVVIFALAMAAGCSLHRAKVAYDEQRFEEAARAYRDILQRDPSNIKAKMGYQRSASRASEQHLEMAREAQKRGQDDLVFLELRKAVVLNPNNSAAGEWLSQIEESAAKKKAKLDAEASVDAIRSKAEAKPMVSLNPRSLEGVDLNFTTRQSLKEILKIISKASGVNIITHTSFPQDAQVSVDLRGLTFQRVLDTLMLQNDLQYRVMDANTILVFKDQQQFKDKFENQLIRTFYLSFADVETVRDTLTRLIPQLKVFVDKRTNAVIVKAKPSDLTTAKRVVSQFDKPKPEVMIYMELLEVTENSLEQIGLLPVLGAGDVTGVYRIGATVDNTGGPNTSKGGISIKSSDIRYLFPNLALDALKSSGDARMVASPNIRVVSGEAGEINIGEKISTTQSSIGLPGLTGTSGTTGSAASGLSSAYGATQTQFNYEDVGVKIKVKPRVHHNTDVTLEIDSKVTTLKSGSMPGRPDMGIREIKTWARLKDGETAMFGGLLKDEEQKSLQGIWGLTDIPVIGKLFGSTHKQRAKTDVVLTIRAVLLRGPDLREEDFEAFDPDLATSQEGPFAPVKPVAAPAPAKQAPAAVKAVETPAPPAPEAPVQKTPEAIPAPQEQPDTSSAPAVQEPSELVVFLSPTTANIAQGSQVQVALLMSGAKGVTSGTIELRLDPKLKYHSANAGDFLTGSAGVLEQVQGKDGVVRLTFRRGNAASDSGTLALFDAEGLSKGNCPVLIQSGRYMVGTNPIPGRVMNALIVVE